MKLGEYLKKTQITQQKFSEMVGVARPFITQIVGEKRTPSLHLAKRIQEETDGNVTINDLIPPNAPTRLKKRKKTENT